MSDEQATKLRYSDQRRRNELAFYQVQAANQVAMDIILLSVCII
jgi:hypothetical protein